MTKVCVIIPYYQRATGLLRRAVQSVFDQKISGDLDVEVVVVDDESPTPPEPDVAGLAREGFKVTIVKRPNGGPALARNTGLDTAKGADVIAFLDSDDAWKEEHLARGLEALRLGAQFYFSNHHDEGATWFDSLEGLDRLIAASEETVPGRYMLSREAIRPFFFGPPLLQTSNVLMDAHRCGDLRFDPTLVPAEDQLYWLQAMDRSDRVAFSTVPMTVRGNGIDIYRSTFGWDNPKYMRRLVSDLALQNKILSEFGRSDEERRVMTGKVDYYRRAIVFLIARNVLRQPRATASTLGFISKVDPGFWLNLPRSAFTAARLKASNALEMPV